MMVRVPVFRSTMKKKSSDAWNPHEMVIYRCMPRISNEDGCCRALGLEKAELIGLQRMLIVYQ